MGNGLIHSQMNPVVDIIDEDQQWVNAAKTDLHAAGRLYDKYYAAIFRYVHHSTMNRALAEDLTANAFLAAFMNLGRFRWKGIPFGAWLYRIATNELRMHYRRQGRGNGEYSAQMTVPSACEQSVAKETHELLHKALSQLRTRYRTVIVLRYFECKSIKDISVILGTRPGTVKSQLSRGLTLLQGILEDWGVLRD